MQVVLSRVDLQSAAPDPVVVEAQFRILSAAQLDYDEQVIISLQRICRWLLIFGASKTATLPKGQTIPVHVYTALGVDSVHDIYRAEFERGIRTASFAE
jgi:hypothetical protein